MEETTKKTLRLTPEAEKALTKLIKHFSENTENKAINRALVELVKLMDLHEKTCRTLNSVSEDYGALIEALNEKERADQRVKKILSNPTKKSNFKKND